MGVCNCSTFCCTLLYIPSNFAIILMGKRELVALLSLSYWCLLIVVWLFFVVPWVCLQFVVFPDHTHYFSYRQVHVKFKDFSRTSKRLSCCFKDWKLMKKTDLHVRILLLKCQSPLLKILVLENQCKIMVPLFGAAYAAPNKGTTILY